MLIIFAPQVANITIAGHTQIDTLRGRWKA